MSLFAKRNIAATHKRPIVVPDGKTTVTELGTISIALPNPTQVAQAEEFITGVTAEFEVIFDPADDVRAGDLLLFLNATHEVRQVRTFVTGKRTDYGEADLERKEVPA